MGLFNDAFMDDISFSLYFSIFSRFSTVSTLLLKPGGKVLFCFVFK